MRSLIPAVIFLIAWAPQPTKAGEVGYHPESNPQPWVRPIDRQGFHLGFPLATVTMMLTPMDTGGQFEAGVEHIETNYYGPAHVHELSDETIIMTEGSAYIRLNHKDFTLTKGEWLHIPKGTVHSFTSTGSPAKWIIVKTPPPLPPNFKQGPACNRPAFTAEMVADVELMKKFYHDCLDDFYMINDADIPGTPYSPTSYKPPFEVRPWVRPLDRPHFHLGFPAASVIPMLSAADTDGAFTGAVEHIETDYYGPPHKHLTKAETIIVIDGSIRMRVSGTDFTLTQGQWLYIPAGNVHSFDSTGSPAKMIILQSPGSSKLVESDGSDDCDRSDFTPAMSSDPTIMSDWYHRCAYDFYMVPEAGLPGDILKPIPNESHEREND